MKTQKLSNNILKKIFSRLPLVTWLVLPLVVYFSFGMYHLTKFETADEHYWIYSSTNKNDYWRNDNGRIKQYWEALRLKDWARTRINDKPGITLAWVGGIGSYLKTGLENEILAGTATPMSKMEKAEKINLYFRVPLLIFNGLFMFVLFGLLKRFMRSGWIALIACSLMLLSPIVVGISQIINPDNIFF